MQSRSTSDADLGSRIRLLVVDDDEGIRTLLEVTISLDDRFTLVGSAGTAADALALLRGMTDGDRPDVVLLDVTLPDHDGIELVAEVHAAAPGAKVALFTGWSDSETLARAEAAGADAVFGKDGDPRGLLDGLAEMSAVAATDAD
jgi:DNA-binding NarL/FixJ family response regulator